jgi:glutathione S-transferase
MAIEIFWASGSPNSWRVLLGAVIKDVAYESRLLEFSKGDVQSPEFRRLNPRAKVPVLRDDGFVLYESLAILEYLDARYPPPAPLLFGTSPRERAAICRIVSEFECYLREPLRKVTLGLLTKAGALPASRAVGQRELEEGARDARSELELLELVASDGPWLAGEKPSAADAAIYPFVRFLVRAVSKAEGAAVEVGLAPVAMAYPRLHRWLGHVEALPGYERTYPPHWRTTQLPINEVSS